MENLTASPTVYVVQTSEDPLVYSYELFAAYATKKTAEERAESLREVYNWVTVTAIHLMG